MNPVEKRSAGLILPLSSVRTERGWGIGELPEIAALAPWLERAGLSVLSLLPLLESALGQDSPYSTLSAFALDPVYIGIEELEDFAELGGLGALGSEERSKLDALRTGERVDFGAVRALKDHWLRRCFAQFREADRGSERWRSFGRFREEQAAWLPDYSLFRALKASNPYSWWRAWPEGLDVRDPHSLANARVHHADGCDYFEWLQWIASGQLSSARTAARRHGVLLAGDMPFMVAEDSADAWVRQDELRFDATVGTPPDEFSEEGQDWGLPAYRWDAIASNGYEWLRQRGRRTAEAYDLVRVDHVVGFYRTYTRPRDGSKPFFVPAEQPRQIQQGEAVLGALASGGTALIAEDLGTVPAFVRASLTRLKVPGYRVLRWEKDGEAFRDPAEWPALSVATTGTHDTEPSSAWWDGLSQAERAEIRKLPALSRLSDQHASSFGEAVHLALLETVYTSASNLLLLPVQDLFGLRDRINYPGTVGLQNWTWRLPWTLSRIQADPAIGRIASRAAELAQRTARFRPFESRS